MRDSFFSDFAFFGTRRVPHFGQNSIILNSGFRLFSHASVSFKLFLLIIRIYAILC
jgi:hypothetical protein